jgi:hypothetical protein
MKRTHSLETFVPEFFCRDTFRVLNHPHVSKENVDQERKLTAACNL